MVRVLGLSLPPAPSWVTSPFMKLLAQDHPPRHYTGASLSVQAQQRTDEIEQIMLSMYNRQVCMSHMYISDPYNHDCFLATASEENGNRSSTETRIPTTTTTTGTTTLYPKIYIIPRAMFRWIS